MLPGAQSECGQSMTRPQSPGASSANPTRYSQIDQPKSHPPLKSAKAQGRPQAGIGPALQPPAGVRWVKSECLPIP